MNSIKRKAISIFENQLLKQGTVLAIRAWDPATFFEIDLHLPEVDMEKWSSVQHIKIKVGEYTYRDYTPALWETDIRTCTLCINTSHDGPGSQWVKSLKKGDQLSYIGVGSTFHKPVDGKRLLCLGDSSTIGHFLALKQLSAGRSDIYGAISLGASSHADAFNSYFDSDLETVKSKSWGFPLLSWLEQHSLTNEIVYIAGHSPTAIQLRKYIKDRKDFNGVIKVQGFWG